MNMQQDLNVQEWYKEKGCWHAHCPFGCEHPQPFIFEDKLICGRCYFILNIISEMIACECH